MVPVRSWSHKPHAGPQVTLLVEVQRLRRLLRPWSDRDHVTSQDAQTCTLGLCKLLEILYVVALCYLWYPPLNLFPLEKERSSTWSAWYLQYGQDFEPLHNICVKILHNICIKITSMMLNPGLSARQPITRAFHHHAPSSQVAKKNPQTCET